MRMKIKNIQMIQMLQPKVLFIALMVFATGTVRSQQTNSFSLQETVSYAKTNANAVKNALLAIDIQKQTNREITAAAYPQVTGTGTLNDFLNIPVSLLPAEITGGAPGTFLPVRFGTKYNVTGALELNQLLFDGQVFVGLQARRASIEFFSKQATLTKEVINSNVQKIYYQLVVGKEQIATLDSNISRIEKLLRDVKEIYKQGFAERLDIDKVTVQLSNLQTQRIRVQSQLDAGNAGLRYLIGMPLKDSLILTDTLSIDGLKSDLLLADYHYEDRLEYQVLQVGKQLGEYNIKRYKLSYLPTLSAFVNYNKNAQRSEFNFLKGGPWFTTTLIGLRLNVPIFDGFAKDARIKKAKFELQKTENDINNLQNSIDNDVVQSRLKISTALATLDNQKRNVALAEKVYNTTKIKYEQGLGSNQEIYTAQTELSIAQNNYYSAMYDGIVARIEFLTATGKLSTTPQP